MTVSDGQLKAFYLIGVGLNTLGLVYSIDTGEYLFAGTFAVILGYLAFRYRIVAQS